MISQEVRDAICELYALRCPESGEVRYIGKAVNSRKRLASHLRDARSRRTPVYNWIRDLQERGLAPVVQVLMCTWDWPGAERELIAQWSAEAELLNVAPGGNEPFCSPSQRAANGRAVASAVHGDQDRRRVWSLTQRLGLALRAGEVGDSAKAKIRSAVIKRPDLFGGLARWL